MPSPLDLPQAACRSVDPDLHFPTGHTSKADLAQIAEAKAVCAGCPERLACLLWSLQNWQQFGIWGGMTEEERMAERRRRNRRRAA
jgi:WhiB family redox-sensing transcriptional regulator